MKVLFVTTKSPLPINDGHALRTFHLLRAVAQQHEVTLLSFVKFPEEYSHRDRLQELCEKVVQLRVPENESGLRLRCSALGNLFSGRPFVAAKYQQPQMRKEIAQCLANRRYDLVHLDMLPLGGYLDQIDVPVLLNEHNVESALLRRRAESTANAMVREYLSRQQVRLERFEREVVSRVSHVVTCSEDDRAIIETMAPGTAVTVVPNGVDTATYSSSAGASEVDDRRMIFVGGMDWFPNLDAVRWFDLEVLPVLERMEPGLVLDQVGRPDPSLRLMHASRIIGHGFVPDVRPYLERAAVMVVPIRIGGGTRLKVLEAMSMGKAIVSTTVGVEGIAVKDDRDVLIADGPVDFAAAVQRLVQDSGLRARLGQAARELVDAHYRWEAIGDRLLGAYEVTARSSLAGGGFVAA